MNAPMAAANRLAAYLNRLSEVAGLDQEIIVGMDGGHHVTGGTAITRSDVSAVIGALSDIREQCERAVRHGYTLDPEDVLAGLGITP